MLENTKSEHDFSLFSPVEQRKWKFTVIFLIIILSVLLLDAGFVRYRLLDDSLAPTYWSGEKVVTWRLAYLWHTPQKQDLVVFSPQEDEFYAGQIIALPGDRVSSFDHILYVNSKPLPLKPPPSLDGHYRVFRVPRGFVYIASYITPHTAHFKLIPQHDLAGRVLAHWQILLI